MNPQNVVFFNHGGRLINPQVRQDGSKFFRLYFDQISIDVWDSRQLYLLEYDPATNTYSGIALGPNERIIVKLIQNYKYPIFVLYNITYDLDSNIYEMNPTSELVFDNSNTDPSRPLQINIAFSPINEMLYNGLIQIIYDDGSTTTLIAEIETKGKGYEPDTRVDIWLSNKGIKLHSKDLWMFKDYDIYEHNQNYKVSDEYKRVLYTHYHDVFPYAGTIKALNNLLKITGWSSDVVVKQLHKRVDKHRFIDVFDLRSLYDARKEGWIKTRLLAITFDMTNMTTEQVHKTFYQLYSLKSFSERYIIPVWFDIFVVGEKKIILYSHYVNTKHDNRIFYVGSFSDLIVYKDVFPFRYVVSQYVDFTNGGAYDYSGIPFSDKVFNTSAIISNIQSLRREIFSYWLNVTKFDSTVIDRLERIYDTSIDNLENSVLERWNDDFDIQRIFSIDTTGDDIHKKAIPIVLHFDIPAQRLVDYGVISINLFVEVVDRDGNFVYGLLFENISNSDLHALPLYIAPTDGFINIHILFETDNNNNFYVFYEHYIELVDNVNIIGVGVSQKAGYTQKKASELMDSSNINMELLYNEFERFDRINKGKDDMIRLWLKDKNVNIDFSIIHTLQKYQPLDPLPVDNVKAIDSSGTYDLVNYQNDIIRNRHTLYGYRKFKGVIMEQIQNWTIESLSKYRIDDFNFHNDIIPIVKIWIDRNNITSLNGYQIIINGFKPYVIQTTTNDPQDLVNELSNSDFQPFTWFEWEFIAPAPENPYDPNFGTVIGKAKDFTDLRTWIIMEILDPTNNPTPHISYTKYSFPEPYWLFRDDETFDVVNGHNTMLDWLSSYWSCDPQLFSLDLGLPYSEYQNLNTRQDLMNFVMNEKGWIKYNSDNTIQEGHFIPSVSIRDSFSLLTNPEGIDLYLNGVEYKDTFVGFLMPVSIDIENVEWKLFNDTITIINNPFLFVCIDGKNTYRVSCEIYDWFDVKQKDILIYDM